MVAEECLFAIKANWNRPPVSGPHRCREAFIPVTHKQMELWGPPWRRHQGKGKQGGARGSLSRVLAKITSALVEDGNRVGWPHRFARLPVRPEVGSTSFVASDPEGIVSVRARVFHDAVSDRLGLVVDWVGDPPGSPI